MFDFKTEFKDINSINGIRDGLIPFVLAYLTKKNNVFYISAVKLDNITEINILNFFFETPVSLETNITSLAIF